ncbi:MAG: thiosulfate oxidation carrier protein SoxY [Anaerolineae bacterium]|nr:thiosulfate oxidation carrier protein SoxY [Anaerolineae bacterium]
MNYLRRRFLKSAIVISAIATTIGTSLLIPQRAIAAYLKDAFAAKDISSALIAAVGSDSHTPSDAVKLRAPDIAENGAVVPVTVSSTLDNVESITIIASANINPLTSTYQLSSLSVPFVSTRIKMGETANIIAVVKSDGNFYSATKEVTVTIGGCGG